MIVCMNVFIGSTEAVNPNMQKDYDVLPGMKMWDGMFDDVAHQRLAALLSASDALRLHVPSRRHKRSYIPLRNVMIRILR